MKKPSLISLFTQEQLETLLFQIYMYASNGVPQNENLQLYQTADTIKAVMPPVPKQKIRVTSLTFSNSELEIMRAALLELNRKKAEQGLECLPLYGILVKLFKLQAGI